MTKRKRENWGPKPTVKDLMINTIKRFENALAPTIIQEAAGSLDRLAKLLVLKADEQKCKEITDKLLKIGNIEGMCYTPEFVLSVSAILHQSLMLMVNDTTRKEREHAAKASHKSIS